MAELKTTRKLLAIAIASVTCVGAANAAVIDGIISAGEYAAPGTTLTLGWATEGGESSGEVQGSFSYVIEGGLIYAALSAPTDFTDNVYGALSQLAGSGWENSKDGGRSFDKLLGSDRLLFGLNTDSGVVSVVIDYLARADTSKTNGYDKLDLKGSDKGSAASDAVNNATYTMGANQGSVPANSGFHAVFGEASGSVIQDVATSLEYNLSHGCGDATDSPDFDASGLDAGCSAVFTFEWSMAANQFTDFTETNILAPLMHASPSKIDHNSVFEPECISLGNCTGGGGGGEPVPEPGSWALLLTGLTGLFWSRRRKKSA